MIKPSRFQGGVLCYFIVKGDLFLIFLSGKSQKKLLFKNGYHQGYESIWGFFFCFCVSADNRFELN